MKPDLSLITSTVTLKTSFTWYNATTALNSTSVKPNDDLKTVATNTADQFSTHLIFPNPTQSQNIFLLMITPLKTSIFKRTLDLKRHPIWNKVYDHSKNHHLKISFVIFEIRFSAAKLTFFIFHKTAFSSPVFHSYSAHKSLVKTM